MPWCSNFGRVFSVKQLAEEFREFLRYLNEEKVEYLVIGGYAVSLYGYTRFTADMDVWIAMERANARRVVRALERFGFVHGEAGEEVFLEEGNIVRMGFPPMRIEILNRVDGVAFSGCYARREMVSLGGLELPFISRDDLVANKKASGRQKDLGDLEGLGE